MKFPQDHIFINVSLKKDKWLLCFILLSTISSGLIPAITSILTGRVFDLLTTIINNDFHSSIKHDLINRSMSIMALGAASLPIMWCLITAWMNLGERQNLRIRDKLILSYLNKSFKWYDINEKIIGDLIQLNRCIEEVRQSTSEAFAIIAQSFVTICALIGVSFYYSWSLTLIILCSSPLILVFAIIFSKLVEKYIKLENKETTNAAEVLTWSMSSIKMIKFYNAQQIELNKFNQLVEKCNSLFIKNCLYASINSSVIRFLTLCMFIQGFWFGSTMIKEGKLNINDVITCFHACLMLGATLSEVFHQIIVLQKGDVANKKLCNFLLEDENIHESQKTLKNAIKNEKTLNANNFEIIFNNLSFAYPSRPTDQVLQNVSLCFPSNKLTFIVGKSGSGKSTLSKLLLKFYNNYSGHISIDNIPITQLPQDWIISNITVVEQHCRLFNDTLRNNILLGSKNFKEDSERDQKKFKTICTLALLDRVIENLPEGLETRIGKNGISLSGGQKQRVALARAFMRDTPILILDEAVSALDIVHRQLLMEAVRTYRKGKTTIILTHELSQIHSEDFVYVMQYGTVVESGFQKDLLDYHDGKFREFWNLRKKEIIEDASNEKISSSSEMLSYSDPSDTVTSDTMTSDLKDDSDSNEWSDSLSKTIYDEQSAIVKRKISRQRQNTKTTVEDLKNDENDDTSDKSKEMGLNDVLKHFFHDLEDKLLLLMGLIFAVIAGVANPVFSFTFSYLLNGIIPSADSNGASSYYLLKWSMIVLCVTVVDGLSNFLKSFILGYVSEVWVMNLRKSLMKVVVHNRYEWFNSEENDPSKLSALALNDLRDLRNLITEFLGTATTFVVVALCGLIWALSSGWKLSLVCISMFPLVIIVSGIYGSALQKSENDYKSAVATLESDLCEIVSNMKTIRYLHLQTHFVEKYSMGTKLIDNVGTKRSFITGIGISITYTLTLCIQAILFYYGIKLVLTGEYTSIKMFRTFTLLLFTIMTCTNLINQVPEVARGQRAARKIYEVIEEANKMMEDGGENGRQSFFHNDRTSNNDLIVIKDLTFSYPGSICRPVYTDLNATFSLGETIAIVGESGSGKSTLISLLTKLYNPVKNSIFIDKTDVLNWNTEALRNHISVVEQSPILFPGTIRDNVTYSLMTPVTDVDIIGVLKYVGIYDLVKNMPKGLDTVVNTDLLSGGQVQRLSIARALLRKHKILILDECTSALDAESSDIINSIVQNGISGTLILAVTHDEQMMKSCDTLMVLQNGKFVQKGSYSELIVEDGHFKNIIASLN